ncbi:hypothetical protein EDB92DRAFT_1911942 [Lactarius akahatsu]|uniref:F-box domain-containing protein n=1 Tax=Lactarius akahatsu TaxID=416441 RepID=A0AAD4L7L5_9AGAM|nr:hypothetical protein EDB92DRAFT_1911942 [Lactarius akahatsu]
MPSAGLLSLPLELLDEVTDYIAASPQEILTLRCVNKALCSLVTPAAFRKIVVHTTDESAQGFLGLLVSTDIAKHVRVIQIVRDERFKRVGIRLRGVCFMLHLIPSLESLITFFPDEDASLKDPFSYNDDPTRYHFFQRDLLGGLACNPNPLPALRSLQIQVDNWFAYPDDLYVAAPFQRIVASLRDLRFLVQDTDYKSDLDHFPAEDFWPDVIWHRVLRPAVNLESLSMSCSLEFGSLIRLDLGSVTFPQLSSLSLSNLVWDDVRVDPQVVALEAEDFIVRHGKTLKKLELQSCTICVPRDRPTLVRSWAAVWSWFADELTELVDLVVEYNFNQRYICFLQEYGFDSNSVYSLRGTEEDTAALEALVMIVKGGKRGGVTSCDGD